MSGFFSIDKRSWKTQKWDVETLERFCRVAYMYYRDRMIARMDDYDINDRFGVKSMMTIRTDVISISLEELIKLQEHLIKISLNEQILNRQSLLGKKAVRSMFINDEEEI
jgi:hypothetical protein